MKLVKNTTDFIYLTILGCYSYYSSLRRAISLIAVLGIPSSSCSNLIFFKAYNFLVFLSKQYEFDDKRFTLGFVYYSICSFT